MEIKGKIHEIGSTQQVSETFKKRDLIIEYAENPSYPEYIRLEALQDKCSLVDQFLIGDEVEVFFNLRGRPWTDKTGKTSYFNSLVVWRINKVGGTSTSNGPAYAAPVDDFSTDPGNGNDLPF